MGSLRLTLADVIDAAGPDLECEVMSKALHAWVWFQPVGVWVEVDQTGLIRLFVDTTPVR